jgi:ribonucleotide reductase alpha subunit
MLPTPPLPADLPPVELTDNARQVLVRRYVRRGQDGKPAESVEEMFWRVAYHVAKVEEDWSGDVLQRASEFYTLLTSKKFFPNSPTFTGAGTPLGQLAACFVLPISDDMGRHTAGIFQTLRDAALIQQTGGGNGFNFSRLRPQGAIVNTSAGQATGPVGFLRVYDHAFGEIAQGGTRRGANMGVMRVDHPDVEEFITSKTSENAITNFNISVGITDAFMQAVKEDKDWDLVFPDITSNEYSGFSGTLEQAREAGVPIRVYRTVRARELFNKIVTQAHHNGEPGVLFLDAANRTNPVPHLYPLESTNPCVTGETLVATPAGWRRADSIQEGDEVCTVLGVGRVATVEVNENMPVFDLYLSDGAVVRVTASHQFHARDSRTKFFEPRRLDELKLGDWVRVFRSVLPDNPVSGKLDHITNKEYGFLVGVLVGDGCYTAHALSKNVVRISTHADETEWNDILKDAFSKIGAEKMYTYVNEGSRSMMMDPKPGRVVADWVKSLPLEPARGPEKRLPEVYINSNREFLVGLLDGLFSTDGSVDLQSNHPLLRFHTSSLELARQLRRILLMFGVYARISTSQRERHDINGREIRFDRPKYDVTIAGESLGKFFEQMRLSHPAKQMRLEEAALKSNFTGGNWAAKVVKIEPAGEATVYDLYEPKSDTWITEGFVSRGCGEQWLGPYENCCLGSVNLAQHFGPDGTVDWETLRESIALSTRFLDDVVEANAYVPAVPQLKESAHRARRIGLGIMGLGDLMYHVGVRYGSLEGQEFAAQLMEFVRYHSMQTSIEMAEERGPFPAIEGSIYDPANLKWSAPKSIVPFTHDWQRPAMDWKEIIRGLKKHGIRNAAQTTVAPTGTIATVAGCEGYGCEPVFALAYIRHVNDNGKDLKLTYGSPLFEAALEKAGMTPETRQEIFEEVMKHGTVQDVEAVPAEMRRVFATAGDVTAEEHVRMAGALQAFVDNSISKTINFPEGATEADVATAYMLSWELGAKGITVYVTGSRDKVVLETHATADKKQAAPAETLSIHVPSAEKIVQQPSSTIQPSATMPPTTGTMWHDTKKPRPRSLRGETFTIETPLGKAFITVNTNGGNQPFEVFINTAKAGSETAAVSEAIGRLISYVLRLASPVAPIDRLREVVAQLAGIGGGRSLGFGPKRVRSLPDGVGQVLGEYLNNREGQSMQIDVAGGSSGPVSAHADAESGHSPLGMKIGDLCPECGEAAVVNEEGCRKCYACAFSEC